MIPPREPSGAGPSPEAAEIVRLIAKGNSKSAVEAAKLLFKRSGTPASEELLVDAYVARVRAMLEHRMSVEAEALVRLVRERHPALASRLTVCVASALAPGLGWTNWCGPCPTRPYRRKCETPSNGFSVAA